MAKYENVINGEFELFSNDLHRHVMSSGTSMELVEESNYKIGNSKITLKVYDKYFFRTNGRASLSVTIVSEANQIFIAAISAGGREGFIGISFGVESELIDIVRNYVEKYPV